MCDYCIESGFVFDFWQHGLFNLPEPYRNDGGEIAIDFASTCYAQFQAPNPTQLSESLVNAAQNDTPYWPLRRLEQALLALPLYPAAVIKAYRPDIAALAVMHNLLRKKPISQSVFQNRVVISASDNNLA